METALFLWFAGVAEGWGTALRTLGFLLAAIAFIWFGLCLTLKEGVEESRPFQPSESVTKKTAVAEQFTAHYKSKWPQTLTVVGVFFFAIGLTIPSKDTLYLMAGGYFGQKVVQSDTVNKVKLIIDAELDKQLSKYMKKE